ncbi:MaoC family dehydratase [Natroniella sp. ANB-PHB2]|uniref:MaoC family dehydratase n=1 Tax=Natroniella sp. ANB-PHB2 TaxID=3384444 RepID=UPI0038D4D0F8
MIGKSIGEISIGEKASFTKTITESDVYNFAGVTGDLNPAHVNEEYAKKTVFKKRIAHGMLVSGLISTVLAIKLPGPGTIYLNQNLSFKAPVYFGDTITAEVEVIEKDEDKNRLKLKTICKNQEGKVVVDGEALVLPPKA